MPPNTVDLARKLSAVAAPWTPAVVGALNGQLLKVARFEGEFVWHDHAEEDECFLVVSGQLRIDFRDGTVTLGPGQLCVVPRGIEHRPVAEPMAEVLLFEPASTRSTGDVDHVLTVEASDLESL